MMRAQDISITVLLLLQELTDADVLSEREEASVIVDAIVDKQVRKYHTIFFFIPLVSTTYKRPCNGGRRSKYEETLCLPSPSRRVLFLGGCFAFPPAPRTPICLFVRIIL